MKKRECALHELPCNICQVWMDHYFYVKMEVKTTQQNSRIKLTAFQAPHETDQSLYSNFV